MRYEIVMNRRLRGLLLWCAATDATFEPTTVRGRPALTGKCIHCRRAVSIALDGTPLSNASLEHIVARHHGGGDDLENLAIACTRCNSQKGYRHDHKRADDPKLVAVVTTLQTRRRERRRDPLPGVELAPWATLVTRS